MLRNTKAKNIVNPSCHVSKPDYLTKKPNSKYFKKIYFTFNDVFYLNTRMSLFILKRVLASKNNKLEKNMLLISNILIDITKNLN